MLKSSSLCLYSSNLGTFWLTIEQCWPFEVISIFKIEKRGMKLKKIFSSETTEPISTKLCWNDPLVVPFQNCVHQCRPVSKMAAITKNRNYFKWPTLFIKFFFLLSKWFQTRRFLWEFHIGSYVKLSSAVGAILVKGPNRRTYFWKRTI
jgi:hypothetical protein